MVEPRSRGTTALKIVVLGEGKFLSSKIKRVPEPSFNLWLIKLTDFAIKLGRIVYLWHLWYQKKGKDKVCKSMYLNFRKWQNFIDVIARVGKTSLSTKFVHGTFDKQQSSSVDASYLEKQVQVGQKRVKMAIWDTAGQEKYHALAKNYY